MKYISDIEERFRNGSTLTRLIIINAAVFFIIVLVEVFLILFGVIDGNHWNEYFELNRHLHYVATRPWTIVSFLFTGYGLWSLIVNLLLLYWFGKIFDRYFTSNQLRGMYFVGGLFGAFFYLVFFNLFPSLQAKDFENSMPGTSLSILAIASAAAFSVPNHTETIPLLGNVKLKHMVIALILIDIALFPHTDPGTDIAHGGAVFSGWCFNHLLKKGYDITTWVTKVFILFTKWYEKFKQKHL